MIALRSRASRVVDREQPAEDFARLVAVALSLMASLALPAVPLVIALLSLLGVLS